MDNLELMRHLDRLDMALMGLQDGTVDESDIEAFDEVFDLLKEYVGDQVGELINSPKEQRNIKRMRFFLGMVKMGLLWPS